MLPSSGTLRFHAPEFQIPQTWLSGHPETYAFLQRHTVDCLPRLASYRKVPAANGKQPARLLPQTKRKLKTTNSFFGGLGNHHENLDFPKISDSLRNPHYFEEYLKKMPFEGGFPLHSLVFCANLFIYPLYTPYIPLYSLSIAFMLTSLVFPKLAHQT